MFYKGANVADLGTGGKACCQTFIFQEGMLVICCTAGTQIGLPMWEQKQKWPRDGHFGPAGTGRPYQKPDRKILENLLGVSMPR